MRTIKHALVYITSIFQNLHRTVRYRVVLSLFDMVEREILFNKISNYIYDNECTTLL